MFLIRAKNINDENAVADDDDDDDVDFLLRIHCWGSLSVSSDLNYTATTVTAALRQNLPIRLHEVDSTVPLSCDVAPAGYPNKNNNKASFYRLALRKHVSTQKVAESTKFWRRLSEETFFKPFSRTLVDGWKQKFP